jgi:RNA polymerase sigma-70 factor (ECF subfamily)
MTPSSVGSLLERYRAYLRMLARTQIEPRLRDKVDLSGVVQQTLLEAFQVMEEFRAREPARQAAWLRQALVNNLRDALRKLTAEVRDIHRERSLEDALERSSARLQLWLADGASAPDDQVSRQEQLLLLAEALETLADDQRLAVERHYLQGEPLSRVAEELGRTPGATAALLYRTLKKLRETLGPLGDG